MIRFRNSKNFGARRRGWSISSWFGSNFSIFFKNIESESSLTYIEETHYYSGRERSITKTLILKKENSMLNHWEKKMKVKN
jgi:hypothetical protein